ARPAAPPVAFAWAPGVHRLVLESRAAVTVAGDTAEARDTVVTVMHATLRVDEGAPPRRLSGTIDSVTLRSGNHIPAPPPGLPLPIQIDGAVDGGAVSIPVPVATTADCASPAAALLATARELLPSVPARLAPGARWTDSVTTTTCRGGVLLNTTTVHSYVVAGPAERSGTPAMRVDRTTTIAVRGEGEQARERVTIAGQGTGGGTLYLDPATGRLLDLRAENRLELTFSGAGRTERVVQEGTVSVREP
ncbi:MAG TPA: hypothetical protein VFX39_08915, partial [Gemmatimonadaceae bacterium]|nr:hypothetical protein [Gemmatimonadaceae bacterium]